MPMSSGGHVASSSGCVTRPKAREIGSTGYAVPIQPSSPIGRYVMATAEHREPCDSRGSCTVLGAPGGETPPGDSSISTELTEVARPFMSAMPPRATKWMRHNAVSAAGLSVVRRTRIAPEIVLATTTHEFVRQLPLAPQFGDELRVQDRMCLRSDRTAAVSCTYPVHEHGLVARVPNGKRRCDRVTQETGTAYQE